MIYKISNTSIEIDEEDLPLISKYTWNFCNRSVNSTINGKTTQLGRYLLDPPDFLEVDHKNRNPLNFKRDNLRIVTRSIQQHNKNAFGKIKYKGVVVNRVGKYQAQIRCNGKYYYLGTYHTPEGAARAYNAKAKELFGELATLNNMEDLK